MVKIDLVNLKLDNTKLYQVYLPTKKNLNKYDIIFTHDLIESTELEYIQFVLYVKYVNKIKLYQPETPSQTKSFGNKELKEKDFPYNGIIYSCEITKSNPLIIQIDPFDLCTRIIVKKIIITTIKLNHIKLNPINWDKIFIINLPRRIDRKKNMINFFNLLNINQNQYEFIEAFDGINHDIQSQYIEKKKSNQNYSIVTSGHFACLLSHIKAISLAKSRGYKQVMILEDDVFTDSFDLVNKLNSIQVPDFDLLYLGGIMSKKKIFTKHWAWSGGTNIMGAYGYILSSSLFDIILNELKNLDKYIDFYYLKYIQPKYKTIILDDIIKTNIKSSDTSCKSKLMIKRLNMI